jgi:hypothetical protein
MNKNVHKDKLQAILPQHSIPLGVVVAVDVALVAGSCWWLLVVFVCVLLLLSLLLLSYVMMLSTAVALPSCSAAAGLRTIRRLRFINS